VERLSRPRIRDITCERLDFENTSGIYNAREAQPDLALTGAVIRR
jgi:hypothetical protein